MAACVGAYRELLQKAMRLPALQKLFVCGICLASEAYIPNGNMHVQAFEQPVMNTCMSGWTENHIGIIVHSLNWYVTRRQSPYGVLFLYWYTIGVFVYIYIYIYLSCT